MTELPCGAYGQSRSGPERHKASRGGLLAVRWLAVGRGLTGPLVRAQLAGQAPAVGEAAHAREDCQAADAEQQAVLQARSAAATRLRGGRGEGGGRRD